MSGIDWLVLSPLVVVAMSAVVVMLVAAFLQRERVTAVLTLAALAAAILILPWLPPYLPRQLTPLLMVDEFALFYVGLLLAATFVVALQGYSYWRGWPGDAQPFYILLLLAALGAGVLVTSTHFASFFLGLQILSLCLYALITYASSPQERVEAALKYLVLAGTTAAFLLFGMALIYAELGTMVLSEIGAQITAVSGNLVFLGGVGLLLVGITFNLALVPFHLWTPDVYQAAPAPVTGFVATVSKGAMFVLLLRYFYAWDLLAYGHIRSAFTLIAIASILAGNLLALRQQNVKRLLACSSTAHLGYLLIPFIAFNALTMPVVGFYLVAYILTTLVAFGVISLLSHPVYEQEDLSEYEGLFWQRPYLAAIFMLVLFSLAALPPLLGLVGTVYLTPAALSSQLWLLLAALVLGSMIGVFYYGRVILVLMRRPDMEQGSAVLPK